jgi:phospholipid/cholesterol/gamma-HCH transport system permease protein
MTAATARPPHLTTRAQTATLTGAWTFAGLTAQPAARSAVRAVPLTAQWDIQAAECDSVGLLWLWQDWGQTLPAQLLATPAQHALLQQWQHSPPSPPPHATSGWREAVEAVGRGALALRDQATGFISLLGQLGGAWVFLLTHPREIPLKALSAHLFRAGVSALGITALVGFLIGIVLSYLSAQQLARFGANTFIVDFLGISILRELGPLLAAILVAGRSGSAMTAQIGMMKINQELDAMQVLGLSPLLRLAWPKITALGLAMPLLALWTSLLALLGGMLAAYWELDLPFAQFLDRFPLVVKPVHLWVGLGKSVVFGLLIGLIACHFGFRVQSTSQSLGASTTRSVVAAITLVIVADAFFAVLLSLTLAVKP